MPLTMTEITACGGKSLIGRGARVDLADRLERHVDTVRKIEPPVVSVQFNVLFQGGFELRKLGDLSAGP